MGGWQRGGECDTERFSLLPREGCLDWIRGVEGEGDLDLWRNGTSTDGKIRFGKLRFADVT